MRRISTTAEDGSPGLTLCTSSGTAQDKDQAMHPSAILPATLPSLQANQQISRLRPVLKPTAPAELRAVGVELVKANEADFIGVGSLQVTAEAGTGKTAQDGVAGVEALDREQVPCAVQALGVTDVHDPVPLRLAEGKDLAGTPVLGWSKHGDIYLDLGPVGGVRDDPSAHLARQTAEHFRAGRDRVVATDRLEVRSCHLGQEAGSGAAPHRGSVTDLEPGPGTAHDCLVEGDQRLHNAVPHPAGPEQVGLFDQQPAIFENAQRMRYLVGLPADIAGDSAGRGVSLGYSGEHRMVERRIADLGLLGEERADCPEKRGLLVEHCPGHPCVKVSKARGCGLADEFALVGGGSL